MPPEQGIASSSSQHGDKNGNTLSLCCKFEIVCYLAGDNKVYANDSTMFTQSVLQI